MNFDSFLTPEAGITIFGSWIIIEFIKRQCESYFPNLKYTKLWNRNILPTLTVLVSIGLTVAIHAEAFSTVGSQVLFGIVLGTLTTYFHNTIKHTFVKANIVELKDSIKPSSRSTIPPPPKTGVGDGE